VQEITMSHSSFAAAACVLVGWVLAAQPSHAAEFFVSTQGNDQRDGRTPATAFATVQRGVDALSPGDTLTVEPGEYREAVFRESLGSADADTTIRARIAGTVLLRGDEPAPPFAKLDGFQFIYAAKVQADVQAVLELNTPTVLDLAPSLRDLEFKPGSWFYDAQAGMLYLSTSDLQPISLHRYSLATLPRTGLWLDKPQRVIVEGIAAAGFHSRKIELDYPGYMTLWGIMLSEPRRCVIRQCTGFLNGGGIGMHCARGEAGGNRIERCVAFANESMHNVECGGIVVFASNDDVIEGCYTYGSRGNGIRHYGAGVRGPAITRDSIAWGNGVDIFHKGGKIPQTGLADRCITLGALHSHNVRNSIIGTINQYNAEPAGDNVMLGRQVGEHRQREFADPDNLDFRLQSTSRLRGSGPDGGDRGPLPYQPNVFFVKPDGNDSSDGLSVRRAWKSLGPAIARLKPGDTLYLEPGVYDVDATWTLGSSANDAASVSIRGRGIDPVILRGKLQLQDCQRLEFQRIGFAGSVTLRGGSDLTFHNCRFSAGSPAAEVGLDAADVENLRVTQNTFAGFSRHHVAAAQSPGLHLSGNLLGPIQGAAVRVDDLATLAYADYNAYSGAAGAWQVGSAARDLASLQPTAERYAALRPARFELPPSALEPVLTNPADFRSGGPLGRALGNHLEYRPDTLRFVGPTLYSATPTTANIEWRTSRPVKCTVAWGDTPQCSNTQEFDTHESGSFSLTGLTPGRTYHFRVIQVEPRLELDKQRMAAVAVGGEPLTFTTPTQAVAPVTYHVAPDGDDARDGLSPQQAWRTVAQAGERVRPGDTVLIAAGDYGETVHVRSTGERDLPITFKARPGHKVSFHGNERSLAIAFSLARKQHVHLDGFYFRRFGIGRGWDAVVSLYNAAHIRVTRCFLNNRGRGNPFHFLYALESQDVELSNCVIANGMYGLYITGSSDVNIHHNVFLRNLITACTIRGGKPQTVRLHHNVFVDSHPNKVGAPYMELGGFPYVIENNVFFLRVPDEQRKGLFFYGSGPGRLPVAQYEQMTGYGGNVLADPLLAGTVGKSMPDRDGKAMFPGDWLCSQQEIDFPDCFVTDATLAGREIGLQPAAFADFHFHASGPATSSGPQPGGEAE
jgi:hypothetical protein